MQGSVSRQLAGRTVGLEAASVGAPPILRVEHLSKRFPDGRRGWIDAVRDVSFEISRGECLAIVGESGSGKSTVARSVVRALTPDSGRIYIDRKEIGSLGERGLREIRPRIQLVPQDPYSSLNPRMTVSRILGEAMGTLAWGSRRATTDQKVELLEKVGLSAEALVRLPAEMSGGQRQRVAFARALVMCPDVIVADEPFSALDVSVQATLAELLVRLKEDSSVAWLLISHDITVVSCIADRVAVMYDGAFVEMGESGEVLTRPTHPYSRALVGSVPGGAGLREKRYAESELEYNCGATAYESPELRAAPADSGGGSSGGRLSGATSGPHAGEAGTTARPVEASLTVGTAEGAVERYRGGKIAGRIAKAVVDLVMAVFGVSAVLFVLLHLSGDPAHVLAGYTATPDQVAATRAEFGLNSPILVQFFRFIKMAFSFNFGRSYSTSQLVGPLVLSALLPSLAIVLIAMVVNLLLSTALGVLIGGRPGSRTSSGLSGLIFASQGIPFFVVALLIVPLFGVKLGWLPVVSNGYGLGLVMPVIVLVWMLTPRLARVLAANVAREMGSDYVRVARAWGATRRNVVWRHALPNGAIGAVSMAGTQLGGLLSGTVIVEVIFSRQGIGRLMVSSIQELDFPVVLGCVVVISVFVYLVNLLTDILMTLIDPRLRV